MAGDAQTPLCQVEGEEAATALAHALTGSSIPYRTIGQPGLPTTFLVPAHHIVRALQIADDTLAPGGEPAFDDDDARAGAPWVPIPFPWATVQAVAAMVLFHAGIVLWAGTGGAGLWQRWAIDSGLVTGEPWRLVTSLFLHVDLSHAIWNGLSMLVFAVPVAAWLGGSRATVVYLFAGVVGSAAAAWVAQPGMLVLGSSGAVAGLFGAWLALAWRRADRTPLGWRPRVRSLGIALLVLPSLIGPVRSGHVAPLAAHFGGMLAGVAAGAAAPRHDDP